MIMMESIIYFCIIEEFPSFKVGFRIRFWKLKWLGRFFSKRNRSYLITISKKEKHVKV